MTASSSSSQDKVEVYHRYSDSPVRVEMSGHGGMARPRETIVRLARVIPEREACLYSNPKSLASVRCGLHQARKGKVTKNSSDLNPAAKLAKQLEDSEDGKVRTVSGRTVRDGEGR